MSRANSVRTPLRSASDRVEIYLTSANGKRTFQTQVALNTPSPLRITSRRWR